MALFRGYVMRSSGLIRIRELLCSHNLLSEMKVFQSWFCRHSMELILKLLLCTSGHPKRSNLVEERYKDSGVRQLSCFVIARQTRSE